MSWGSEGLYGASLSLLETSLLFTSLHHFNSFSLTLIHHSDRGESSQLGDANKFVMMMAGEQVELEQRRKSSVLFFYLLICLSIYFSIRAATCQGS